ncbi:MAG: alpha/beta fold hydrolase [Bacteroidota bacterium]
MNQLLYFETHVQPMHKEWLLFVHGAGGSTRTWKRQIEQLGAHYNLLVVDLPGHGKNKDRDLGMPQYSFEIVCEKIWEVADHLRIEMVHLIGVSLGAVLCLQMRLLRPERVLSVVLPGAIVRLNFKLKTLANTSLALAKVIGYPNFYKMSAFVMMPRHNHKRSRDVFIKESRFLTISEFKKWTQLYYHLNSALKKFFRAETDIPHLLVMGSQDHLFLKPAQAFAAFHENAQIEIIDGCGHVVSIEQAEIFNGHCLDFLAKIPRKATVSS